jgi:hypothetical protein
MPIATYSVTDGVLEIGAGPLDVSCQVKSLTIEPTENVTTDEAVHVLCGETLPASDTADYTYKMKGSILQDLTTGGFVDYTWNHIGDEVPFTFCPNTTEARQVTGTVRVIPLTIGGESPKRATSDFEWAIIGTPTVGAYVP